LRSKGFCLVLKKVYTRLYLAKITTGSYYYFNSPLFLFEASILGGFFYVSVLPLFAVFFIF
jgi:hypothetical protein